MNCYEYAFACKGYIPQYANEIEKIHHVRRCDASSLKENTSFVIMLYNGDGDGKIHERHFIKYDGHEFSQKCGDGGKIEISDSLNFPHDYRKLYKKMMFFI